MLIKTTGLEDYLDPASGNAWVQALIIGGHGVGKTPFAAKWPKPIFAMCEHGTMSIAKDRVPYADIRTDADMTAFVAEVRKDCLLPIEKRKWLTVVVDTIDAYQKRLMDFRVLDQSLERFTGWDNWDWLDARVSKALRSLSNLPIHLVVNMHYRDIVIGEGDDKRLEKESKLKGDLKTSVYQEFDLIGFMETYYVAGGGERQRKHRIRWWPEPGFEMVRARAVGVDGVLLPQFTPVDFAPSDFQVIFDAIASGVDGLEESQVVVEVQTEDQVEGAALPQPDQGAGPVSSPNLPPANRPAEAKKKRATIKEIEAYVGEDPERAQAAIEAEKTHEDGVRPSLIASMERVIKHAAEKTAAPEVEQAPSGREQDEADQSAPPATAQTAQNGRGTAEVPVELDESILNNMDGPKYAALDHVHSPDGRCLKNTFVEQGEDGKRHCPLVESQGAEPTEPEPSAEPQGTPPEEPQAPAAPSEPDPAPPEPTSTPTTPPAASGAVTEAVCGTQPQSLVGRFPIGTPAGFEPCGQPLNADNKAPLGVVKFKVQLCNNCYGRAFAAA